MDKQLELKLFDAACKFAGDDYDAIEIASAFEEGGIWMYEYLINRKENL